MTAVATAESILAGLEALQKITGLGGPLTAAALAAIDAGLKAIADHAAGKTDAATMMATITDLAAQIATDNTAADAYDDAKFSTP